MPWDPRKVTVPALNVMTESMRSANSRHSQLYDRHTDLVREHRSAFLSVINPDKSLEQVNFLVLSISS